MTTTETQTKRCSGCTRRKPVTAFDRCKKQGRQRYCRECKQGYNERNRSKCVEYSQRSQAKYPDRKKARGKVSTELIAGRLTKPSRCERCGKRRELQAHHADYSKPLDVEWLCSTCHREADGES